MLTLSRGDSTTESYTAIDKSIHLPGIMKSSSCVRAISALAPYALASAFAPNSLPIRISQVQPLLYKSSGLEAQAAGDERNWFELVDGEYDDEPLDDDCGLGPAQIDNFDDHQS